jgi:site-specific DNA recombinase
MTHMNVYLYARQSKGDASVDQQLELADKRAAERGWTVAGRFADRSISATTGEPRPGYDAMIAGLKAGKAKGIVVRHYDRLYRQPRELEDVIDDTEGTYVESVFGGGYDLGTADGRMQARVVGAFARGEAEKKGERQRLGHQRRAAAGTPKRHTPRPFGWQEDRTTLEPTEAEAIREAARALLAGGTLSGIARDWTARGLFPPQAGRGRRSRKVWNVTSIVKILRSPRLAGISTYHGDEVGEGTWEPILGPEVHLAVVRLLADPGRRKKVQGVRTLLGGIARCPCGNHLVASMNSMKQPTYRCNPLTQNGRPGPHTSVQRQPVDEYIDFLTVSALITSGHDLVSPATGPDVAVLRDEAAAIRANLNGMAEDRALGLMTREQMIAGTERGSARLAEIQAALERAGQEDVLAPLVYAEDMRAAWTALPTDRQRAVIASLFEVTVIPVGKGRHLARKDGVLDLDAMGRVVRVKRLAR